MNEILSGGVSDKLILKSTGKMKWTEWSNGLQKEKNNRQLIEKVSNNIAQSYRSFKEKCIWKKERGLERVRGRDRERKRRKREIERECERAWESVHKRLIYWFTRPIPAKPGPASSWIKDPELFPCLPHGGKDPCICAIIRWLPQCTTAGHWFGRGVNI